MFCACLHRHFSTHLIWHQVADLCCHNHATISYIVRVELFFISIFDVQCTMCVCVCLCVVPFLLVCVYVKLLERITSHIIQLHEIRNVKQKANKTELLPLLSLVPYYNHLSTGGFCINYHFDLNCNFLST